MRFSWLRLVKNFKMPAITGISTNVNMCFYTKVQFIVVSLKINFNICMEVRVQDLIMKNDYETVGNWVPQI